MRISDWSSDVCSSDLKIPQTDNWVFPKCPRQLRSRAPGEPPKGESSTLSRARSGLLSRPPQRRNAVSEADQRTQSDPAFLKYRERVATANRIHGCHSRECRDRESQISCVLLFACIHGVQNSHRNK